MTALYIIGGILLFIALLLLIPVGIRIKYNGDFSLFVKIGPVSKQLIPKKEKKIKISYYSEKNVERRKKKQQKKAAKKKKAKKPSGGTAEKKDSVLAVRLKSADTAPDMIARLYDMLVLVTDRFAKRLHIKIFRLDAVVGSDNAAKTALLYGGACSLAGCIASFLAQHTELKQKRKSINVTPDFLAEKTTAEADVLAYVRFGGVFAYVFEIRKTIFEIIELLQEDNGNG